MSKFISIDDFELGKPLGTGRFGQVWLTRHKETGFILAIKMMQMSDIKTNIDVKNLRREAEVHLSLDHPNILKMYGYFYDSLRLYYVMEYAGKGDIWSLLRKKGKFAESEASTYIKQICMALNYMHYRNIIHRDIKPENILIGCDDTLKLADFGWSVCNKDKKRNTFCGTAEYLPPEMCKEDIYNFKADIWCVGILCYEFVTGVTPFAGKNTLRATKTKILTCELEYPPYLNEETIDFISLCCKKDPEERISLEDALNHPFITQHKKIK